MEKHLTSFRLNEAEAWTMYFFTIPCNVDSNVSSLLVYMLNHTELL